MATREKHRGDIKILLNRPDEDDLFDWPDDYDSAIDRAVRFYYKKTVGHYPDLFYQTEVVTTSDGGSTYDLPDDQMGEMSVWTPPGPGLGRTILPGSPHHKYGQRFYVVGRTLHLTRPKRFTPGLYVQWVPASVPPFDDATKQSPLPAYFDEAVNQRAAFYMAQRPGFIGNPNQYKERASEEWLGDRGDTSDAGILGILSRQFSNQGYQGINETYHPWWRGIGG